MTGGIVDAHHHVWWFDRPPWLQGPEVPRIFGSYDSIRRDYLVDEYARDIAGLDIDRSVYVQVNLPPEQAVWEVEAVADAGRTEGLMQAIVGQADLGAPDLADQLDAMLDAGPLRGIRQQLHWHPEPRFRFAPSATSMLDPSWQRGLAELERRDLVFEVQVFPAQLEDMLSVIDAHPGNRFVLLHAGMPVDRSPEGMTFWSAAMSTVARRESVDVKLSGLGTFTRSCTAEQWAPVVKQTIEHFGPRRCMFGSNFPIERLWTTYSNLMDVFASCIADLSTVERRDILENTAARVYGL